MRFPQGWSMPRGLAFVLVASLAACGDTDSAGPPSPEATAGTEDSGWFVESAQQNGLDFTWQSGHETKFYFPEIIGGGGALLDADADGDLDVYMVQGGSVLNTPAQQPGNQLFLNDGSGHFRDASEGSGAQDKGYGMGAAVGDFDGDGLEDLLVTNLGRNTLLRNEGAGRFSDVTVASGLLDEDWSSSAAFLDYDRDGDLDLFVVNYVEWSAATELSCESKPFPYDYCSPKSYAAPARDKFYRNEGGHFVDATLELGLDAAFGNGLGIVVADFDKDGFADVFVANDGVPNQIWMNNQGQGFVDGAVRMGCAVDQDGLVKAGMGTHAIDADDDGDEDLLVVNLNGEPDSFFRNEGTRFSDRTQITGLGAVSRSFTRFGMGFADFDQDGLVDLYQANGRVIRDPSHTGETPFAQENLVLQGTAELRFAELLPRGGVSAPLSDTSRAALFGDLNGDGAVDLVVINRDSPAYLLINKAARGNWVLFDVREAGGRVALGAEVSAALGERNVYRYVRSAYSYCAANDSRVHLGLGEEARIESVEVLWADGERESFGGFDAGQVVRLQRGSGN